MNERELTESGKAYKIIKKVKKGRGKKFPENFMFCFDFTIKSNYEILFHFESN